MKARVLLAVAVLALCLAPVAGAKFRMWLTVADSTPRIWPVDQGRSPRRRNLDYDLKLIAVAPGKPWDDVVGRVTGDSSLARASIPRDGFAVPVTRVGPNRWRAFVKFPRPGQWRLIIPNGAPIGFMIPPPVVQTVVVGR